MNSALITRNGIIPVVEVVHFSLEITILTVFLQTKHSSCVRMGMLFQEHYVCEIINESESIDFVLFACSYIEHAGNMHVVLFPHPTYIHTSQQCSDEITPRVPMCIQMVESYKEM